MISNLLNAVVLVGSLVLIGGFYSYRRGRAEPWANRAFLCLAICALCEALMAMLLKWHGFGMGRPMLRIVSILRPNLGGMAIGLFIGLALSGQLWKIGPRRKNDDA